jgi:hypothetical protein
MLCTAVRVPCLFANCELPRISCVADENEPIRPCAFCLTGAKTVGKFAPCHITFCLVGATYALVSLGAAVGTIVVLESPNHSLAIDPNAIGRVVQGILTGHWIFRCGSDFARS